MKNYHNIWIKLLPFFFLYSIIAVVFAKGTLGGDEPRYIDYGNNLLNGFYADQTNYLISGPGYPILLVPILYFKLSFSTIHILNGFFLYVSLILTYKTIREFARRKESLWIIIVLGFYYPIYEKLPVILPETLTWLLISLISFLFIKYQKKSDISWKYTFISSIAVFYLVMTKVIFGYVILIMLVFSFILFVIPMYRNFAKKLFVIFLFSNIFCLPYLYYTYNITGNIFYWSSSGGYNIYMMTSPFDNELGNWKSSESLLKNPNHSDFISKVVKLSQYEQDQALKKKQ